MPLGVRVKEWKVKLETFSAGQSENEGGTGEMQRSAWLITAVQVASSTWCLLKSFLLFFFCSWWNALGSKLLTHKLFRVLNFLEIPDFMFLQTNFEAILETPLVCFRQKIYKVKQEKLFQCQSVERKKTAHFVSHYFLGETKKSFPTDFFVYFCHLCLLHRIKKSKVEKKLFICPLEKAGNVQASFRRTN